MSAKSVQPKENKGKFVFGDSEEEKPGSVLGILPLTAYLTQYVDGASKKCTRVVFTLPNSREVFILKEQIQGSPVVTPGNSWFEEAFNKKLDDLAGEAAKEEVEAI